MKDMLERLGNVTRSGSAQLQGDPGHGRVTADDAPEAVQDLEARLRYLSDANIIGFIYGNGERVLDANEAFLRMVGYSHHELRAGKLCWLEIAPPECRERDQNTVEEPLARGALPPYERQLCRRDGSRIWVLFGSAVVRRSPLLYVGFAMDLSERKLNEERLSFHASLLEHVRSPIIATDLALKIIYWNRAASALYQWKEDEVVGKSVIEITVVPQAREEARTALEAVPTQGCWDGELDLVRKDGTTFPAHIIDSVVRDLGGKVAGLVSLTIDLTDRKQMENALRESESLYRSLSETLEERVHARTAELVRLNRGIKAEILERREAEKTLRERFVRRLRLQDEEQRRIARELHDGTAQTLTALSLNLALMKQQSAAKSKQAMMQTLTESVALTEQASQEIRTLSYLLRPPELDGENLAAAIRSFVDGFAKRTNVEVDLDITAGTGSLSPEAQAALFRVLQESLNNIYRHSGSPTAAVRILLSSDVVTLEVRDQGRGIPEEVLRGDGTSRASLGVGIAGMRERVSQMGGKLEIASCPGRGTALMAFFPVAQSL